MKLGAFEYLQKPITGPDELRLLVGRALRGLARPDRRHDRLVMPERSGRPR